MNRSVSRHGAWFHAGVFTVAFVVFFALQRILYAAYARVGSPVSLGAYTLQADPQTLPDWYADFAAKGTLGWMIRTELIDNVYAIVFGLMIILLVRLVAVIGAPEAPHAARLLFTVAPLFAIAQELDITENAFSLAMLTDPVNFPDAWARLHGVAARIKYGLAIVSATAGAIVTIVIVTLRIRWSRRSARRADGEAVAVTSST